MDEYKNIQIILTILFEHKIYLFILIWVLLVVATIFNVCTTCQVVKDYIKDIQDGVDKVDEISRTKQSSFAEHSGRKEQ